MSLTPGRPSSIHACLMNDVADTTGWSSSINRYSDPVSTLKLVKSPYTTPISLTTSSTRFVFHWRCLTQNGGQHEEDEKECLCRASFRHMKSSGKCDAVSQLMWEMRYLIPRVFSINTMEGPRLKISLVLDPSVSTMAVPWTTSAEICSNVERLEFEGRTPTKASPHSEFWCEGTGKQCLRRPPQLVH